MKTRSQTYQNSLTAHLMPLSVFLTFMLCSFLFFFHYVQSGVEQHTRRIINNNVERQSVHFEDTLTPHFEYLEGMADTLQTDGSVRSEENLRQLQLFAEASALKLFGIADPDGVMTYTNGAESSVKDREYFNRSLAGSRSLSDPIISKVDGTSRIILSVPIMRDNKAFGVLAGSCDVSSLSHMLFSDIYNGNGHILIVNTAGRIISSDYTDPDSPLSQGKIFFDFCSSANFLGTDTAARFRKELAAGRKGIVQLEKSKETLYLSYRPLSLSDWSLCYLVPYDDAQESYRFISDYEFILFGFLLTATLLLLLVIFRSNSKKEQELLVLGQTDALTGILNKQSTEDQINSWLASEQCIGFQIFMMLDIDGFKSINDVYGHMTGDEILRELGTLLRREFRDSDIVGRIGGDEFCILLKNNTSEYLASTRAELLCRHVRQLSFHGIPSGSITISVGAAICPHHGRSYNELYASADKALYKTKRGGKNGYTVLEIK